MAERLGNPANDFSMCRIISNSFGYYEQKIDDWRLRNVTTRFLQSKSVVLVRTLWPRRSQKRTQTLLSFDRVSIRFLVDVITRLSNIWPNVWAIPQMISVGSL